MEQKQEDRDTRRSEGADSTHEVQQAFASTSNKGIRSFSSICQLKGGLALNGYYEK